MVERAKFFDDIAGVAGGAFSAIAGIGEELAALVRARVDEALSKMSLVRREEFEVVSELAAGARAGQELAEARLTAIEARLAMLETASPVPAKPVAAGAPEPPPESHDPHGVHGAPGGPPAGIAPKSDDSSDASGVPPAPPPASY